jgi:hypothetical protein
VELKSVSSSEKLFSLNFVYIRITSETKKKWKTGRESCAVSTANGIWKFVVQVLTKPTLTLP